MASFTYPLSGAIANAEGYGLPGAIPTTANNPGDLALGDIGFGTMGQGITVFPSAQAGAAALDTQVSSIYNGQSNNYNPNETIAQMAQTYAGGGQGSINWSNNVSKYLGVTPGSTLGSIGGKVFNFLNNNAGTGANSGSGGGLPARIAAFAIGMVCIAGGVLMLRSTQTVIQVAGQTAKTAATIAA